MNVTRAVLGAVALLVAAPLGAQAPGESLRERMEGFLSAVRHGSPEPISRYFGGSGEWTWVSAYPGRPGRAGVWRFPAERTLEVISFGGPVCESFRMPNPEGWPLHAPLATVVVSSERRWRSAGPTRFVPHGAPAQSPVFVEWRREGGTWVIARIGDATDYRVPLPGRPVSQIERGSPTPTATGYAGQQPWFVDHEPVTFDGLRFRKIGLPRALRPTEIEPVGAMGRVLAYAERGGTRWPEVIYLPVSEGVYQPYQTYSSRPCQQLRGAPQ